MRSSPANAASSAAAGTRRAYVEALLGVKSRSSSGFNFFSSASVICSRSATRGSDTGEGTSTVLLPASRGSPLPRVKPYS